MAKPLRITIVLAEYNMSGGTRVMAIYADRLRRRGHTVVVVAPPTCPRIAMGVRARIKSLLPGRDQPQSSPNRSTYFEGLDVETRVLDRSRPVQDRDVPDADVVIATFWITAEWVASLGPNKGVKAHFVQNQEGNPLVLWPGLPPRLLARVNSVYQLPLAHITISRSLQEWLVSEQGCDDVMLVPNAVDFDLFQAPQRGRQSQPTVGLLYAASFAKGLACSLKALERVREARPDLRVIAFGLDREVPELPLPPGTSFHHNPPQDQIRELYAACDVWLCGSLVEGFHLPPLEAMACRCPVVSTRVGGPDESIQDGVNGYLVPVGDAEGLADRLLRVLSLGPEDWRRMSDAAYETARSYTWDDATDRLEAALRELTERRRSPHPRTPAPAH